MKKKIVIMYLGRRGAGPVYSLEITKSLLDEDIELLAILSSYIDNKDKWIELSKNSNLILHFIDTYTNNLSFIKSLFKKKLLKQAAAVINNFKPAFVYIPMRSLLDSFIIDYIDETIPTVVTLHDINQHSGEKNIFINYLKQRTVRKSSKYIVLSESFISAVAKKFSIDKSQIVHIPHANFDYYTKREPQFDKLNYNILFFGRIHKYKGIDILLEAFKMAHDIIPNLKLTIAGNGNFSSKEQQLINELKPHINLIQGWINDDDVEELFYKSDLVLLTYREASQSGVIPLAYSMGKGVIASNIGGLREQIAPGSYNLINDINPEEFANAIIAAYYENKILDINKLVYNFAKENMGWNKSAQSIVSLF